MNLLQFIFATVMQGEIYAIGSNSNWTLEHSQNYIKSDEYKNDLFNEPSSTYRAQHSEYITNDVEIAETAAGMKSLCDLAGSTDLGTIFPGSWNCNTTRPLDRYTACSWYGVGCDTYGSIVSLSLRSIGIQGTIPLSIGNLTSLQRLALSNNKFHGLIPTSIGSLHLLTFLGLSVNKLTLSIPSAISCLSSIQFLGLSYNKLTGLIPSSIGNFNSLTLLLLAINKLTSSIPSTFMRLTSLHMLALSTNKLTGVIPTWIGNLKLLTYLGLGVNTFSSSIPSSIGYLTSLQRLWLSYNQFTGVIPTSIGTFSDLHVLGMFSNSFRGSIPSAFGLLTNLELLSLHSNQLTSSIPTSIGQMASLALLDLSINLLSSSVPSELTRLSQLNLLKLANNRLTGVFPLELCKPSLGYIGLKNNPLSCIPWCQYDYDWTAAVPLLLPRCQDHQDQVLLDIQNSLGVSSAIQTKANFQASSRTVESVHPVMSLTFSYFSPIHVTNAYGYMVEMSIFQMWGYLLFCSDSFCNKVIGKYSGKYDAQGWVIPSSDISLLNIKNSTFYVKFQLDQRTCPYINGSYYCPLSFGFKFTLITKLRDSVGWTFDSSPPYLLPSPSLTSIYARGVCQTIWSGITCEKGLVTGLRLSGLGLRGTLPTSIGLLTGLTSLDLSANALSGSIGASIGLLSKLYALNLNLNSFVGTLPAGLANLTGLNVVTVTNNKLSGSVPTFLNSLVNLQYLNLDFNNFVGEVPGLMCDVFMKTGVIVSLMHDKLLTCYQPQCVGALTNSIVKLDSSMDMCVPTLSPTVSPTAIPSSYPTSFPTSGPTPTHSPTLNPTMSSTAVLIKPLLNTDDRIAVSVCASVFVLLVVMYIVYRKRFSNKAISKKVRRRKLKELPVHRVLTYLKNETEDELLSIITTHIGTVNEKDADGQTAFDIVLHGNKWVSSRVVYVLLRECLPIDTGDKIFEKDRVIGWMKAVQSEDDNVVFAVENILKEYKEHMKILTSVKDGLGRKCIDIASKRCKEAMYHHLYLHGRFDIEEGPAVHKSATSLVLFAKDYGSGNGVVSASTREASERGWCKKNGSNSIDYGRGHRVALKFMRNGDQFVREIDIRGQGQFDPAHVVSILTSFGDESDEDKAFRDDAVLKGFSAYPYCIVMEAANQNLKHIIDHEGVAGSDWVAIRDMTISLAKDLEHLHSKGIIHGDLKPLNVLRVDLRGLKLTDLDASASFAKGEYAGNKFSSGYVAPEMLFDDDGIVRVRSPNILKDGHRLKLASSNTFAARNLPFTSRVNGDVTLAATEDDVAIKADPSQDMWALGCVLYNLCTGASLFHVNTDDNIVSQHELLDLYSWDDDIKESKLSIVKDPLARNLLSQLLSKDPKKRPSASRVMEHAFVAGRRGVRLQGEQAAFDVFLSYRVASDAAHAEVLYYALRALGLKVWWDKLCLLPGQNWEEGFCKGLVSSANFVCLASRGAIKDPNKESQNWGKLVESSRCDNVLLEWRLALELKERGMLNGVFPVMIGDKDDSGNYSNYRPSGCHPNPPDVVVASVEAKVREHLDREGLGSPYKESMSVKAVLETVMMNQGGRIRGNLQSSVNAVAKTVFDMTKLQLAESVTTPVQPVVNDTSALEKVVNDLKLEVTELSVRYEQKECENNDLRAANQQKDYEIEQKDYEIEQKDYEIEQKDREIEQGKREIERLLAIIASLQSRAEGVDEPAV